MYPSHLWLLHGTISSKSLDEGIESNDDKGEGDDVEGNPDPQAKVQEVDYAKDNQDEPEDDVKDSASRCVCLHEQAGHDLVNANQEKCG